MQWNLLNSDSTSRKGKGSSKSARIRIVKNSADNESFSELDASHDVLDLLSPVIRPGRASKQRATTLINSIRQQDSF